MFKRYPDRAFTTGELCEFVYCEGKKTVTTAQRNAVIRGALRLERDSYRNPLLPGITRKEEWAWFCYYNRYNADSMSEAKYKEEARRRWRGREAPTLAEWRELRAHSLAYLETEAAANRAKRESLLG